VRIPFVSESDVVSVAGAPNVMPLVRKANAGSPPIPIYDLVSYQSS